MAVYPNNRYASASPYRQLGGAAPGFDALQSAQTARKNRFSNPVWSGITGGDRATGLLPLIPGAISSTQTTGIGLTVPPVPPLHPQLKQRSGSKQTSSYPSLRPSMAAWLFVQFVKFVLFF
jgi:hypothetical protein